MVTVPITDNNESIPNLKDGELWDSERLEHTCHWSDAEDLA